MIWFYTTLLILSLCLVIYISIGILIILKLFRWLWNAYKERIQKKELKVWDATLMDGLEDEEWDNKHHNENI